MSLESLSQRLCEVMSKEFGWSKRDCEIAMVYLPDFSLDLYYRVYRMREVDKAADSLVRRLRSDNK